VTEDAHIQEFVPMARCRITQRLRRTDLPLGLEQPVPIPSPLFLLVRIRHW
jgi:hypothetical protein